jgi:glycosyltransferase involved in cell wall biosynthesis
MANSVLYLLKEDELRNRLSIGAALDAKKRFGHERMIGEYLTYYKEITRDWQSRIGNK